jgi:hypothetical protein
MPYLYKRNQSGNNKNIKNERNYDDDGVEYVYIKLK